LLLHAGLLNSVLRHRPQLPPDAPHTTMLWLRLAPPRPPPPPVPKSVPGPVASPPMPHHGREPVAIAALTAAPAAPALAVPAPQTLDETPPDHISVGQILSMAKRDLGKIDRELRTEQARTALRAAPDSAMQRLRKGIEEAHQAAPNKWYQAAKVEDITPPGNDARKIYRITGALGTYCVHYADKNRANQGKANVGEALIGACPHMF
jgi:hypothetical protein